MAVCKTETRVHIRWMIRNDLPRVLDIEDKMACPWTEKEFYECLRESNCIAMVAESADTIDGYIIYELHKKKLHIRHIVVNPLMHRQGIARQMIEKLKSKLCSERRNKLQITLDLEFDVPTMLFFKAMGFKGVLSARDDDGNTITMTYTHGACEGK